MTGVAASTPVRLTPRFVARHSIAAALLLGAHFVLNRWDLYQHPRDSALFYILMLAALAFAAGPEIARAVRGLNAARTAVFALMIFLALPWGEWLKSDAFARESWSRLFFEQVLWTYPTVLFFTMFPGIAVQVRRYFVSFVQFVSARPVLLLALPPAFFLVAAYAALGVYQSVPIIMDSASYLFQARIFSQGELFAPQPPVPEFFSLSGDGAVMAGGRWFSMYQPGYPAFLATLIRWNLEWLLSPLLGALTLGLWISYAKRWHGITAAVLMGLLLFLSPFFLVMSGAIMAHPLELFLASLIIYLCRWESEQHAAWRSWMLALALLAGMPTRGFSLLAFCWPAVAFVCWNQIRQRKLLTPALLLAGIVGGMTLVGLYQWKTTGSPTMPGYNLEQKEPVRYGFQETWKGQSHTPYRGLENISNNWLAMSRWLTGWTGGCFLFLFAVLFLHSRFRIWDYILFFSALSLILFYYFYFFQDLVYGPRFWYLMVPVLLLLIAKLVDVGQSDHPMRVTLTAVLVVFFFTLFPHRLWNFVRMYDPSRFQATFLKNEIQKAGNEKLLVFLDPRIAQSLVNWNDPFLRSPVILCRDLQQGNIEAIRAFPDHRPVYFRLLVSYSKNAMNNGYRFAEEPDPTPPGYFSFFELTMTLQSGQYYPDQDIFDIANTDLFTGRTAQDQWNYLNAMPPEKAGEPYRESFRQGLVHAARLLLLPLLAFQEGRTAWSSALDYDAFRAELQATRNHLGQSGEIGKPILLQLDKLERRIDRNDDGTLENAEITRFLATKTRLLL